MPIVPLRPPAAGAGLFTPSASYSPPSIIPGPVIVTFSTFSPQISELCQCEWPKSW